MSETRTRLGEITGLRVHGTPVKQNGCYDPVTLVEVSRASIDPSGMLGWNGTGWVVDVHHQNHPDRRGSRRLSIGFTSHYERMQERFGTVPFGVAAENVLVATDRVVSAAEAAAGMVIRTHDGWEVALDNLVVARPCREFTSYLLQLPHRAEREEIAAELEFLDGGMRGFVTDLAGLDAPAVIGVGDEVFLRG
jgi:hypothetical protein